MDHLFSIELSPAGTDKPADQSSPSTMPLVRATMPLVRATIQGKGVISVGRVTSKVSILVS